MRIPGNFILNLFNVESATLCNTIFWHEFCCKIDIRLINNP